MAEPDWDGGWAADRARKRRAWLALTPAQRLAWLEDMLDLAAETGGLDHDRRRRAEAARRAWAGETHDPHDPHDPTGANGATSGAEG